MIVAHCRNCGVRQLTSEGSDFPPTENTGKRGAVSAAVQVAVSINDGPCATRKGGEPIKLKVAFDDEGVRDFTPKRRAYAVCTVFKSSLGLVTERFN